MSAYHPARVDLLSAAVRQDPYPYFSWLRHEAPVLWVEKLDAYLVSRYDDVAGVLRDPVRFSSIAMRRQAPGRERQDDGGKSVITSDPPEHTRLRNLLQDEFRQRPLRELEPRIENLVGELTRALTQRRQFDLVRDFTVPLPVTVIQELLDIDRERQADFKHWSDCLIKILNDREGPAWERARAGVAELIAFFLAVLDEREDATAGRGDILSVLLRAEHEGRLTRREIVGYSILLLTGGNETTTNLIGGMVLALLRFPEQLAALQADPARLLHAIEEGLRYCSPVQGVYRRAIEDTVISGVEVPAGRDVITLLGSANHDETKFPAPETFDIGRPTGGQLGFGMGIHHCLGAHLGRLEARVAFEALLPLLPRFAPAFESVHWNDNWFVRGPDTLTFGWRH